MKLLFSSGLLVLIWTLGSAVPVHAGNPYENHLRWHFGESYYEYNYEDPTADQGAYRLARTEDAIVFADLYWGLFVYEILSPGEIVYRDRIDDIQNCWNVLLADGDYAYVGSWGGFEVVDISDPSDATVVATLEGVYPESAAKQGDYIYMLDGYVRVYDVSEPTAPALIGSAELIGNAIAVDGDHAYVTKYDGGIYLIDISDPSHPTIVEEVYASGHALYQVEVMDEHLYVADPPYGLRIFELANPTAPTLVGGIPSGYSTYRFVAEDSKIFLDSGPSTYIDVSDPANPLIGAKLGGVSVEDGSFADGFAYVAASYDGIQVFEIRDGTGPQPSDSFSEWAGAHSLSPFQDHLALMIDDTLHVLDVSNPTAPASVATLPIPSGGKMAVHGDYAYIVASSPGLRVVDLTTPSAPWIVGTLPGIRAEEMDATTGRLYCSSNARIYVVDTSVPAFPALLLELPFNYFLQGVAADGDIAYTGENFEGWGELYRIDSSDPENPVIDEQGYVNHVLSLAVAGERLYVTTSTDLLVLDSETFVSTTRLGDHDFSSREIVLGTEGRLYGRNGSDFHILVNDGSLRHVVSGLPPGGGATSIAEANGKLFVSNAQGLHLYELPSGTTSIEGFEPGASLELWAAPNPMNRGTQFSWSLESAGPTGETVTIEVFAADGRLLRRLTGGGSESGSLQWDGLDSTGRLVPSGVVFSRLTAATGSVHGTLRIVR